MAKSYDELTPEEKIAQGKKIDDTNRELAIVLLAAARYVAGKAILVLNEGHFTNFRVFRTRTIPCLLELLAEIRELCYHRHGWHPGLQSDPVVNTLKIEEIDSVVAGLNSIPVELKLKAEVINPIDQVLTLKID